MKRMKNTNYDSFDSGAIKEVTGKGRCDLLPTKLIKDCGFLPAIERLKVSNSFVDYLAVLDTLVTGYTDNCEKYDYIGSSEHKTALFYEGDDYDRAMIILLLLASKQFEEGANKYGEGNWKMGVPKKYLLSSCIRHYLKAIGICNYSVASKHWGACACNLLMMYDLYGEDEKCD